MDTLNLDSDGIAEIVAGLGPSRFNVSTVKIYKADGAEGSVWSSYTLYNAFIAYEGTYYGTTISVDDLGY